MENVSGGILPMTEERTEDFGCIDVTSNGSDEKPFVLIADDEEIVYRIIRKSLEQTGDLKIAWARDGFEALEMCEKQTPDLILLDVSMPKMDGIEFIKIFRKRPDAVAVPILLVSSFKDFADRVRGLDLGAVDIVTKPFKPLELAIRTKRHLEMRQLYKEVIRQRGEIAEKAGMLEAILNSAPSGLAVLNTQLHVIRHNNQFSALFPASGGEIDGVDISTICSREVLQEETDICHWNGPLKDALLRTLKEEEEFRPMEIVLPPGTDQGGERYLTVMAIKYNSRENRLLLDVRDCTEQKEADRKMGHRNRLAMLGDLSVGVAHEINNPNAFARLNAGNMKAILGQLKPIYEEVVRRNPDIMLGKMSLEEAQNRLNEVADNIMNATDRIISVVKRLESFGRAEGPNTEEVDVVTAVKNSISMTITQIREIEESNVEIDDTFPVLVQGSQVEYEQVVINVIMNAVHAIGKRREMESASFKGTLRIWLEKDDKNINILIADNGIGMDRATTQKIYTPYFTTKERGKGTGLGLSISHGIITKYKGRIEVQSAPMKGTTFKIILPLMDRG